DTCGEGQADAPPRSGYDVAAGDRPALPAQPTRDGWAEDGIEEREEEQGPDHDGRDDQRHDQLRPELQELKQEEEVPVRSGDGHSAGVGRCLELKVLLD